MVKITDANLCQKLRQIEGTVNHLQPAFIAEKMGEYARWLHNWSLQYAADPRHYANRPLDMEPTGILIRGYAAIHRYMVYGDGEVVFSRQSGITTAKAAKHAGFRVVD